MTNVRLRAMGAADRAEVAELICVSMNTWDILHGLAPGRFSGGPAQTDLFGHVYERLDPGCCVVAESPGNGRLAGSCYYRERETHLALGIMNVHPNYFGRGVARSLLDFVTARADDAGKPLRLVASVMNLDSFSLYNRAGFVPRLLYQDFLVSIAEGGTGVRPAGLERVRDATLDDVDAIAGLELELSGISRRKDYRYFIENADGFWHALVYEGEGGRIDGFLASVAHPLFDEIGPGFTRTDEQAAALLVAQLDRRPGGTSLVLVPTDRAELSRLLYALGGRNCELHAAQVRGPAEPFRGVSLPTFLPETG